MNDAPTALLGERDFMKAMDRLDSAFLGSALRKHPERRRLMARARRLERAGIAQLGPNGSPRRLAEAVASILDFRAELARPAARGAS